jgi:NifU-like protein involved in Fe-S cluster formation
MSTALPNVFGYPDPVWRRFRSATHAGAFDEGAPVVSARAGTPASRGLIDLAVRLDPQGRVAEARFRAYGCPTTIAVGEWLAELAQGRNVEDLRAVSAADILGALEIPEDRAHCAVLGEDVLRSLLTKVARS